MQSDAVPHDKREFVMSLATSAGTTNYFARFPALHLGHLRHLDGLAVSSIGIGSYLGDDGDAGDRGYAESVQKALSLGCNLIDTAINYRNMQSERALGAGIRAAIDAGIVKREEIVVCTKGGYVAFDKTPPQNTTKWFKETFVDTGLAAPNDVARGCHVMSPRYLANQIDASCRNLGLDALDVYYIHNPETQLGDHPRKLVMERFTAAFTMLEEMVAKGRIGRYGVATWAAFIAERHDHRQSLQIEELVALAEKIAGKAHHFKLIQLPFNLAMTEAYGSSTQRVGELVTSALESAEKHGVAAMTSVPLMQTEVIGKMPPEMQRELGFDTDAQRALQFARSAPGVTAALCGMSNPKHVEENMKVALAAPATGIVRSMFAPA